MNIRNNDLSDKSIVINITDEVSICLCKQQYDEFISLLIPSMEQEFKYAYIVQKQANEQRFDCLRFMSEIRELFYDCSCGICLLREMSEIDSEKLSEILDKYSNLLGFEE
ncbi:hypothetical protein [Bacteroides oleiciplenus]|uniref:hypothetical protein n=1 Tax=Bacteroides oleiciplenus TaxID=626931 RepID=UPI0026DAD252|nr:hypothetical protein [Bacteroides oleiciplenus]